MARILLWLAGGALVAVAALGTVVWRALRLPEPTAPAAVSFSLVGVTVVNPGRSREAHQTIEVRDGRIRRVAGSEAADDAGPFRDLQGAFVVPGLVDLHTHLPPDNALRLTPLAGLLYLAHGVT